jgi:osmotically-inducible protein OsmY
VLRILLLLVLVSSSLPAQIKSAKAKTPPPQGATAPQDAQVEAEIRTRLAKSVIGEDGFKVRVQGGVAYWDGTTDVIQHKGAATRMAKSAGAKKVVNNIKVGDAAKEKVAGNLEQGRRRVQVKRSEPR